MSNSNRVISFREGGSKVQHFDFLDVVIFKNSDDVTAADSFGQFKYLVRNRYMIV